MPQSIEDFKRNNAISLYHLYDPTLAKTPAQGVIKFTILIDPSLVIITVLPMRRKTLFNQSINLCLGEEKKIFREIMHFTI